MELKLQIKVEKAKFVEDQQEFLRNPSVYLKKLEDKLGSSFENNRNGMKKFATLLLEQLKFKKRDLVFNFNTGFAGIDFLENGLKCQNKGDSTRYCFSQQRIESDSILEIELLFGPGSCDCASFGLIEDYPLNSSSNTLHLYEISERDICWCRNNATFSSNLTGKLEKIEKPTRMKLMIQNRELIITSNDGSINLKGKLLKERYYLSVSPCCRDNSFEILEFADRNTEFIEHTVENLFI